MDNKKAYHTPKKRTLQFSDAVEKEMLLHSKKIPGCKRPKKGSLNHFANWAILEGLKKFGCDFKKLFPEYYH